MEERFNIEIWSIWPTRYLVTTKYDLCEDEVEEYEDEYDDEFYEIMVEDRL